MARNRTGGAAAGAAPTAPHAAGGRGRVVGRPNTLARSGGRARACSPPGPALREPGQTSLSL
eukprot:517960-Lingulodinium_polyedra.AAC.1